MKAQALRVSRCPVDTRAAWQELILNAGEAGEEGEAKKEGEAGERQERQQKGGRGRPAFSTCVR